MLGDVVEFGEVVLGEVELAGGVVVIEPGEVVVVPGGVVLGEVVEPGEVVIGEVPMGALPGGQGLVAEVLLVPPGELLLEGWLPVLFPLFDAVLVFELEPA